MDERNNNTEKNNTAEDEVFESNAARRIRARDEMDEPTDEPELKINKWQNFWYHNKFKVIMISAFAFILTVAAVQFFSRQNPDIYVLYAGPQYITANENRAFCDALETIMDDYNGDGKRLAQLTDFIFMTETQIDEFYEEAWESELEPYVDALTNAQTQERYSYEVFGGNAVICILAEEQYLEIHAAGGFIPLAELFDEIPEGAYDDCGVLLTETKFYKFYGTKNMFPEDAVIAVRKLSTMSALTGRKRAEKKHEYHVDMFKRILSFEYPEGYTPSESET